MNGVQTQESVAVVAVRDTPAGGIEVFLLRDPSSTRYGLPSAPVEEIDVSPRLMARCHGITSAIARSCLDHRKPFLRCLGHWIAATRELFVRTGILFCTQGDLHTLPTLETRARLFDQRNCVERHDLDFADLLEAENVFCDLRPLVPFAKWQVPCADGNGRMEMFLSRISPADPIHSWPSVTMGQWLAPASAMVQWQHGGVFFDFKTFGCLRMLTDFPDADRLFAEYRLTG